MSEPVPALVTLHLWRVSSRQIGTALARMALDRRTLRRIEGVRFVKLLGTGSGRTFTPGDANLHRWALLATWASADDAAGLATCPAVRRWDRISDERCRMDLRPLSSRGRWTGRQPFGDPSARPYTGPVGAPYAGQVAAPYAGPVAAITRARIAARKTVTFWRAVPPVAADLHRANGLRLALGVGEAPIGLQGTFSVWDSAASLRDFAHQRPAHSHAVARTVEEKWYTEELFARFAVLGAEGTVDGRDPLR